MPIPIRCRMGMRMLKWRSWHAHSYSQLIPVGLNGNEHAKISLSASSFPFGPTVLANRNRHAKISLFQHAHSYSNELWRIGIGMPRSLYFSILIPIRRCIGIGMPRSLFQHPHFHSALHRNRDAKISISACSFPFGPTEMSCGE